jgi:acyl-phosphate glycerol 3-phosphate acyltransferase
VAAAAYLLGSVPFGIVMARLFGLGDLRQIGSGNIGATNVLRTGNKTAAALTLILDAGKGGIAVLIARALFGEDAAQVAGLAAFSAIASRSSSASGAARAWRPSSARCWRCSGPRASRPA